MMQDYDDLPGEPPPERLALIRDLESIHELLGLPPDAAVPTLDDIVDIVAATSAAGARDEHDRAAGDELAGDDGADEDDFGADARDCADDPGIDDPDDGGPPDDEPGDPPAADEPCAGPREARAGGGGDVDDDPTVDLHPDGGGDHPADAATNRGAAEGPLTAALAGIRAAALEGSDEALRAAVQAALEPLVADEVARRLDAALDAVRTQVRSRIDADLHAVLGGAGPTAAAPPDHAPAVPGSVTRP